MSAVAGLGFFFEVLVEYHDLLLKAEDAKKNALAIYSHFKVGAALLTESGKVYTGMNIESSSYGLTVCAERVALFKALSEGERHFKAIAIIADSPQECPPCGACRQVLWDYAHDIDVVLSDQHNNVNVYKLSNLFPHSFGESFLENEK